MTIENIGNITEKKMYFIGHGEDILIYLMEKDF